ncbi:MAG: hypothetical protein J7J16_02370 [Deltaproteobacteria bacterium]|nr:hypothetical protein [Deltaproteobacteria bacterium]
MLNTYKVLALVLYENGNQMATTNVIRAKNKEEARERIRKRYMKLPKVGEVVINIETDVIQLGPPLD